MKFTVLMAVYHKENPKWLDESLHSILINQELKPNEVVLVEDGKLTDDLYNVIEKYSKYLKRIVLKENNGLQFALNEGLKHVSNEWIARMDSDDISHPERFLIQTEYLKLNTDVDVLGTALVKFIKSIKEPTSLIFRENPYELVKFRTPMSHATVFYRKSKLLDVGGYEGAPKFMEDYWLWVKMISSGYKLVTLPNKLYFMRSDESVDKRRGGWNFFINEIKLQNHLIKHKLINYPIYIRNILVRGVFRLSPYWVRSFFYNKLIGQSHDK